MQKCICALLLLISPTLLLAETETFELVPQNEAVNDPFGPWPGSFGPFFVRDRIGVYRAPQVDPTKFALQSVTIDFLGLYQAWSEIPNEALASVIFELGLGLDAAGAAYRSGGGGNYSERDASPTHLTLTVSSSPPIEPGKDFARATVRYTPANDCTNIETCSNPDVSTSLNNNLSVADFYGSGTLDVYFNTRLSIGTNDIGYRGYGEQRLLTITYEYTRLDPDADFPTGPEPVFTEECPTEGDPIPDGYAGQLGCESPLLEPAIDVSPFSTTNEIFPASYNLIAVAVLGSNTATGDAIDFDATQVDPATLKLGVGEAQNVAIPWVDNFDSDTNIDVAFGFRTQDTGILCGDTEVTLVGETYGGVPFTGTDTIATSDCVVGSCHP